MDRNTIRIDPDATKLRRVGRVARRRMRIDGAALRNGIHSDGTLTVRINGLESPTGGATSTFTWQADRPIALIITRSGLDGEDVRFQVGPARSGVVSGAPLGGGYVAFGYDVAPAAPAATMRAPIAAPTGRERQSILAMLMGGAPRRSTGGSGA